jgi:hypothetical protein
VADEPATNGTAYRIGALERRLDRIDNLEPAVMKQEINDVKAAAREIAQEVSSMRKLLMGFMATFALSSVTIVVSVATLLTQR